jgi:hypothetical protein
MNPQSSYHCPIIGTPSPSLWKVAIAKAAWSTLTTSWSPAHFSPRPRLSAWLALGIVTPDFWALALRSGHEVDSSFHVCRLCRYPDREKVNEMDSAGVM